jgi:2-oxoisovalerate dehydrogenase E1 component
MATTKTDPKLPLTANGAKKAKLYEGLTREQLIWAYRVIYTSRRIDDREILLKRSRKFISRCPGPGMKGLVLPLDWR